MAVAPAAKRVGGWGFCNFRLQEMTSDGAWRLATAARRNRASRVKIEG